MSCQNILGQGTLISTTEFSGASTSSKQSSSWRESTRKTPSPFFRSRNLLQCIAQEVAEDGGGDGANDVCVGGEKADFCPLGEVAGLGACFGAGDVEDGDNATSEEIVQCTGVVLATEFGGGQWPYPLPETEWRHP